jgi:hypothetical protein
MHVLWQGLVRECNSCREHWSQEKAGNDQTCSVSANGICLPYQDGHTTCYETVQGDHTLFTTHAGDVSENYSADRQTRL